MRYLLLPVLVIFIIGFFVVEDAFGIKHEFVFSHPGVDEPGVLLTLYVSANALGTTKSEEIMICFVLNKID